MSDLVDLAQHLPPSGRYASAEEFLAAFPASANVKELAAEIIKTGRVAEAQVMIAEMKATGKTPFSAFTAQELADAVEAAGIVPGPLAQFAVESWAEETGRTVDPATGEITEQPATPKPPRGQLPESVLDTFRQFYGAGSKHQFDIGRVVDDALIEFAGKFSANQILKAAAKEMDLSRAGVLKCQMTWHATDPQLREEFDMLTFEHFYVVAHYLNDRAAMWQWLSLAVDSAAEWGGRFMPAKKLEAKIKKHLGIEAPEPTFAELVARALAAAERVREFAPDERKLHMAEQACDLLSKLA